MQNLLQETIEILEASGKTLNDVKWVGTKDVAFDGDIKALLNVEYDLLDRHRMIVEDLLVVGDDWWLERGDEPEYNDDDGYEAWVFIQLPKPKKITNELNIFSAHYYWLIEYEKQKLLPKPEYQAPILEDML